MSLFIGLMSGTSADGIDAALVDFSQGKPSVIATHSHSIPNPLKQAVFNLAISSSDEINTIRHLDGEYGELFGKAATELCRKANVDISNIKAIGSHGQTVRHYPPEANQRGYSLQIGDPNIIAEATGITTVADFRRRDIAAGGQGAPLAPALHNAVLRSSEIDRVILNTGGIANVTYLPLDETREPVGFDTGPANGLMDSWSQKQIGQAFDQNGQWALSGEADVTLLHQFMSHPYFSFSYPKSTGREDFNLSWLERQLQDFNHLSAADIQATLLSFTVETICNDIERLDPESSAEVYICGGGAHNKALMAALKKHLSPRLFESTEILGLSPDWVEAVAFAWMAKQTLEHLSGNLPSVTGASRAVILGGIYLA